MARGRPPLKSRGRPPKGQQPANKPKYLYSGPAKPWEEKKRRGRKPKLGRPPKTKRQPWEDEEEEEEDDDEEMDDEEIDDDDEATEEEDDDDDTEISSEESTPRLVHLVRKAPPEPREEVPDLFLPPSSDDLVLKENLMRAVSVYEVLRQFSALLRLSPFRLEDFLVALCVEGACSPLLAQTHICLLRCLLREDEAAGTTQGAQEVKDSINGHLYFVDNATWPQCLRVYLSASHSSPIPPEEYPQDATPTQRLALLEFLCDSLLQTQSARDKIGFHALRHDDHCRACHRLGDLLCCESCSAVFHLHCLEPPLERVPQDDAWICTLCASMRLDGVGDPSPPPFGGRLEPIGWDRHQRRYWFIARRLFIEEGGEEECIYYSSADQLEQLLALLSEDLEGDLLLALRSLHETLVEEMSETRRLTKEALARLKLDGTKRVKLWFEEEEEDEDGTAEEEKRGVLTRLKTGTIEKKPVQLDPIKAARNEAESTEQQQMLLVSEGKRVKRVHRRALPSPYLFKLGLEGGAFSYRNKFNGNALALNKHQHAEERDKKRFISHKFSVTPASDFKWIASAQCFDSRDDLVHLLRATTLHLESLIAAPFLHPNWPLHKQNWTRAVDICSSPRDFLLALMILESSLKPCLFNTLWADGLGHLRLERQTQLEREERKKAEKRERLEEQETLPSSSAPRPVKFSLFKVKHQIWKQRGEEYRLTGAGGWFWRSSLRRNHSPQSKHHELISLDDGEPLAARSSSRPIDQLLAKRVKEQRGEKICYSPLCLSAFSSTECYSPQCSSASTRSRFNLNAKIARRRCLGKGQLPPCPRFSLKNGRKSLFILPPFQLRRLARNASLREVAGFSYSSKFSWSYSPAPRPTFRTCWLWRCVTLDSLAGVALQLRLLWHSLRWDDLQAKAPPSGQNVQTTETEVITTELLKRRDLAPFGIRSEYLVRRIVVPLSSSASSAMANTEQQETMSKDEKEERRSGLRERKRKREEEEMQRRGPSVEETWVHEEELDLWELRQFGEKLERQQKERARQELVKKEPPVRRTLLAKPTPPTTPSTNSTTQVATPPAQPNKPQSAYALIKTAAGQTFKVPHHALQGKGVGAQILIKTGNSSTTTATVISTSLPPVRTPTQQTPIQQQVVRMSTPPPQKIQLIRQTPPTTTTTTTTTPLRTSAAGGSAQIPLRLPDGRIQILQIPLSLLQSSTPIQIALPPATRLNTPIKIVSRTTPISTTPVISTVITSRKEEEEERKKRAEAETEREVHATLNAMLDRVERDEKDERRRWKQQCTRLQNLLQKNVADLRRELKRRKEELVKKLEEEIRSEMKRVCVCNSQENQHEMVQCTACNSFFHWECLLFEREKKAEGFVCAACRRRGYCICEEEQYDERRSYICCDTCQQWFHTRCVGLLQREADSLPEYHCPLCAPRSTLNRANLRRFKTPLLTESLRELLDSLLPLKCAAPFRKPVDRREAPDYYALIEEPMDFSEIGRRIEKYQTLAAFTSDVALILQNCRYYNDSHSSLCSSANSLEASFLQKLNSLRQKLLLE